MPELQSVYTILVRLWRYVNPHRRKQFFLLLGLTLLSSVAEVISLGAVVPFIGVITQPEKLFDSPTMSAILVGVGVGLGDDLVLPVTLAFAGAAVVAGALRLLLLWVGIRLGNATGAELSVEVYRRTLYQPYEVHVARSSSEIISGITQKVSAATGVLVSLVAVVTSSAILFSILMTLIVMDPVVAILAAFLFTIAYGAIALNTRKRLMKNGESIANEQTQVVKALQEGLGAIRDVLLDGAQMVYCHIYEGAITRLQRAFGENSFINLAPRYVMEALGIVLIAIFVLVVSQREGGVIAALPVLGMLALGAQRLLPLMQQLYGNWSVLTGSKAALQDVLALLEQPVFDGGDEIEPLRMRKKIVFENVSFGYGQSGGLVLKGVNLEIRKGARIGFVGSTGSGKSTMLDLLMGLLEPVEGRILVDGCHIVGAQKRAWQKSVAHVPQNIFLADATIAENIAFGIPLAEIDYDKVRSAAKQAKASGFIESKPDGYDTVVGEQGVRLSGGQRQRLGIARALYKQANVLIFDEATSALDHETEEAVMAEIEGLNSELTILIIAHRVSTLKGCDSIVRLEHGKAVSQDTLEAVAV